MDSKQKQICNLCINNPADKTNSHIVPSFLIAMICSYDHSYKRGKELMFTLFTHSERVYTGDLPSTKYEEVFQQEELSDERIREELSNNYVAKDYVFCKNCEERLGILLEGPYSGHLFRGNLVEGHVSYMFWTSVVWRMSMTGDYDFKLTEDKEQELREKLSLYLNSGGKSFAQPVPFTYRILYCKNFCKTNGGILRASLNEDGNVLSMIIGDIAICFTWALADLPDGYTFYGLENEFREAPVNDGSAIECHRAICMTKLKEAVSGFFMNEVKQKIIWNKSVLLNFLWQKLGRPGNIPESLAYSLLLELYDNSVKIGERHTPQRLISLFNKYCKLYDEGKI